MATAKERALVAAVVLAACLPYLPVIPDYFVQDDFGPAVADLRHQARALRRRVANRFR